MTIDRTNKRYTPLPVSAPVRTCPELSTDQIRQDQTREEERTAGVGLSLANVSSLPFTALTSELYGVLDRAVAGCDDTCRGRAWPRPRKEGIRKLIEQYGEETARAAARETREIVQSQNRAPNVTNLFAKKCADVAAYQQAVRDQVREALA